MKFLTVNEVAQRWHLNRVTIYHYIRTGKLDAIKLGKAYRISEKAIEDFEEKSRSRIARS